MFSKLREAKSKDTKGLNAAEIKKIKRRVLNKHVLILTQDLGPPKRYFPALAAEELLTLTDRELIQSEVTTQAQVQRLVDILSEDRGGERAPLDILVEVLKKERVHRSVAQGLEKELAKSIEEAQRIQGIYYHI